MKYTQTQQVIDTLRNVGGYATLGKLYQFVDTSAWATKTPNESIRRIVQESPAIFKIQPGLWALEECREEVLKKFQIKGKSPQDDDTFTHSYYQGLIIEIGNMNKLTTYVPAQDQNKKFLETPLKDICSTVVLPKFGYDKIISRAKTVDVIWFNHRNMPDSFFEVEHSTDIQNSVTKFCDLQDYNSRFVIVAPESRHKQFDKVMSRDAFKSVLRRVLFCSYETISQQYDYVCKLHSLPNKI